MSILLLPLIMEIFISNVSPSKPSWLLILIKVKWKIRKMGLAQKNLATNYKYHQPSWNKKCHFGYIKESSSKPELSNQDWVFEKWHPHSKMDKLFTTNPSKFIKTSLKMTLMMTSKVYSSKKTLQWRVISSISLKDLS